jgi:hypothetical protein
VKDCDPPLEAQWLVLSPHVAKLLITCDKLKVVREVEVFHTVSHWTNHHHTQLMAKEQAMMSMLQLVAPLIMGIKFKL